MSTHYVSNVIMESKDIFVLLKSGCYLTHLSLWEQEQATGLSREVTAMFIPQKLFLIIKQNDCFVKSIINLTSFIYHTMFKYILDFFKHEDVNACVTHFKGLVLGIPSCKFHLAIDFWRLSLFNWDRLIHTICKIIRKSSTWCSKSATP